MKKFFFTFIIFCLLFMSACNKKNDEESYITVYAYDSFCGEWGAGEDIAKNFEAETGIKVKLVSCQGANQMYPRIVSEGEDCSADVVVGLSNQMVTDSKLFYNFTPDCKEDLIDYDTSLNLVPFDWGVFAFVTDYDNKTTPTPSSLEDLTDPVYKDKIVLIDPRTSSVGAGLLVWTIEALGEKKAFDWWHEMSENALTIADSWSSAYGLFTEHEAEYVISYSTSPVYHRMYEDNTSIQSVEFSNPYIKTIEYIGILDSSLKKDWAIMFCNYLLTEGQNSIAICNTMFPANTKAEIDLAFEAAYMPQKFATYNTDEVNGKLDEYLDKWIKAVTE